MPLPNELCHAPSSMNIPSIRTHSRIPGNFLHWVPNLSCMSSCVIYSTTPAFAGV